MKPKQKENYNKMLAGLKTISQVYKTASKLYKDSEKDYGLDYVDALEMAYENIQELAKYTAKGIRIIK